MATPKKEYPSFLAWEIPWTEGPGGLQSLGSQLSNCTATEQFGVCGDFMEHNCLES